MSMVTRSLRRRRPAAPIRKKSLRRPCQRVVSSHWDDCGITYDHFIRTTDAHQCAFVQEVLQQVYDAGDIYFDEYGGLLLLSAASASTPKRSCVDGKCPDHLTEAPRCIEERELFLPHEQVPGAVARLSASAPGLHPPRGLPQRSARHFCASPSTICASRGPRAGSLGHSVAVRCATTSLTCGSTRCSIMSALSSAMARDFFESSGLTPITSSAKTSLRPHGVSLADHADGGGVTALPASQRSWFWTVEGHKMSKSLGQT